MCIRDSNGPARKVEIMQLIHNVVACNIRHTVAQVFKIANLYNSKGIEIHTHTHTYTYNKKTLFSGVIIKNCVSFIHKSNT